MVNTHNVQCKDAADMKVSPWQQQSHWAENSIIEKGGKVPFKNKKNKQDKDRVTSQSPYIHRSSPVLEIYLPSCPLGGVNSCLSIPLSSHHFMSIICTHASSPPFSLLLTSVSMKLPGYVDVVNLNPPSLFTEK